MRHVECEAREHLRDETCRARNLADSLYKCLVKIANIYSIGSENNSRLRFGKQPKNNNFIKSHAVKEILNSVPNNYHWSSHEFPILVKTGVMSNTQPESTSLIISYIRGTSSVWKRKSTRSYDSWWSATRFFHKVCLLLHNTTWIIYSLHCSIVRAPLKV